MARDRIAPNCTIRHPVWPIVAPQRLVGFSARLAGFSRIRWHQRRARNVERASFSDLVSNRDFRGTSLRQEGERALTGGRTAVEKRPSDLRAERAWRWHKASSRPGRREGTF